MRLFVSVWFSAVWLVTGLRADTPARTDGDDPLAGAPAPLREAVEKFGRDANRWAYTIHTITRDKKGRITEDTIARIDPSQHYDVQWTLLKTGGKDATETQQKKFRKQHAKLSRDRRTFGELLDLTRAQLAADGSGGPAVLSYVVPIKPEGNGRFPVDRVEVVMRVDAETHTLRAIDLRLKEAIRAMLVAKLKNVSAAIGFKVVDTKFTPVIATVRVDLGASIALIPVEQHTEQTRGDFKRVTPYDDRFVVKPGPLRTIDF